MDDQRDGIIRVTTWVWYGITPYRCEWSWNRSTDILRLERATGLLGSLRSNSKKRAVMEEMALHHPVDRARLHLQLSDDPSDPDSPEAAHLASTRLESHGQLFGLVAFVAAGLLGAVACEWTARWIGADAANSLAWLSFLPAFFVMKPAREWFEMRFRRNRNRPH